MQPKAGTLDRIPLRDMTMTARTMPLAILAGCLVVIAGCSGQQVYESGTAFRVQECQQIPDDARRAECMTLAKMSYKEYQQLKRDGAR